MRVLVTGGTGVLGRRLVPHLVERGWEVAVLSRRPENDPVARSLGAAPVRADLFDAAALAKAAEGADAVVHAATAIPTRMRPRSADWATNDRIRTEGTRCVLAAARDAGARQVVFQSITWLARRPDGGVFDEASPPLPDGVTRSAAEGERLVAEAGRGGLVATTLRFGIFYAPEASHLRAFRDAALAGRLPVVGDGAARLSLVHVHDAATAVGAALDRRLSGTWHVVDDEPVAVRDLFGELARRLGAPPPRRVPAWLATLLAGRVATATLTTDAPTGSAPFRRASGWKPRFPTYREGLADAVAAWRAEGSAPRAAGPAA